MRGDFYELDAYNGLVSGEHSYDANGNLTQDNNRGYTISYYYPLNLPKTIKAGSQRIDYYYTARGEKLMRRVNNDDNQKYVYWGNFVYLKDTLLYALTPEGRMMRNGSKWTYEYYLKDHLGNVRLSIQPTTTGSARRVQEDHYYPFGLPMPAYSYRSSTPNKLLYNTKELQDDIPGLRMYDYGARMYDAQVGRWSVVDPATERRIGWSPFTYCLNNPILRIDPNGLTDFTFDKKTGKVKQVGEKNNDPDRILKTNRKGEIKYNKKGEAKVAIGGIEKGILKDGQNFKNEDQIINVGGKDQPSVEGVKTFVLKLSEYVGTEIKGFSYSSNGSGDITDMVIGKYRNNTYTSSYGSPRELQKKYGDNFSFNNILEEFHTHPNGELGATRYAPEHSQGVNALQNDKPLIPNARFIILFRIQGEEKPGEYDYTHEYRPK